MGLSFPKAVRLSQGAEYQRLRKEGVSLHGKFMVLNVLLQAAPGQGRAGLITSRRVGGAVVRNKVRRRMRELVRLERPRLVGGVWFALIARASAARAPMGELQREFLSLGRRAGLFVSTP